MLYEELRRIGDMCRRAPFLHRLQLGSSGEHLTDDLVRLATLRLKCLAGCITG